MAKALNTAAVGTADALASQHKDATPMMHRAAPSRRAAHKSSNDGALMRAVLAATKEHRMKSICNMLRTITETPHVDVATRTRAGFLLSRLNGGDIADLLDRIFGRR